MSSCTAYLQHRVCVMYNKVDVIALCVLRFVSHSSLENVMWLGNNIEWENCVEYRISGRCMVYSRITDGKKSIYLPHNTPFLAE